MRLKTFSPTDYLPESARDFLARRLAELTGVAVLALVAGLGLALGTWSVKDPSWNHAADGPVHNLAGPAGAIVADLVMQIVGIAVLAMLPPVACWGWRLLTRRNLDHLRLRFGLFGLGSLAATALASALPATGRWPLPSGLGGILGDAILALPRHVLGHAQPIVIVTAVILAGVAILSLTAAAGFGLKPSPATEDEEDLAPAYEWVPAPQTARPGLDEDSDSESVFSFLSLGALLHGLYSTRAALGRMVRRTTAEDQDEPAGARWRDADFGPAFAMPAAGQVRPDQIRPDQIRREPTFTAPGTRSPAAAAPAPAAGPVGERAAPMQPRAIRAERPAAEPAVPGSARIDAPARPLKPASRPEPRGGEGGYHLPSSAILTEPRRTGGAVISEDALSQNARLLEGVLEDFGVKGDIINVRPGPVVTLYELEPAPGIKSSRVIGLADDIARSMSAVSARVAVVQGRNAIGIELPNQRRETVFLRELIGSEDFVQSKHKLAIALGKSIGGESVIVDLARMPHLLVAGTTGSGKSVAINTMILSLLYRMRPDECRLIMVDPKMLELSVYDGIPHLLTPVVTDPKKAVVALKWAVREMEDRYKNMSKLGVRNIDGFNARIAEAAARGERITRTVQTGYDRDTGEAIYEQEEMDLAPLPYIVVIVDEMADLMMVAGKDIEGAIQRLAQMARAAGIHLIMATQRPSVDVITGTIKANFPTRISFQVTSKIDSRTILGEQGAEQLLGQGDMLYMAGGGRISRVHGPFVSDAEVENVVAHLKSQGKPDYLDAITEDVDGEDAESEAGPVPAMDGEDSGDLYDRAVAVVLRDKKCSTSYIQRRLQVGYNKAASLVERMEKEGLVGSANHAGKREILVGGGIDRGAFDPGEED